jgi:hypothetical protein
MTRTILEGLSALFAIGAAALWFLSGCVKLPTMAAIGTWNAAGLVNREPFYAALRRIAVLNQWAATSAAVSALLQAALWLLRPG